MTLAVLDADPGEQVLADIEAASGVRVDGCPWRALRDPFVTACVKALGPYKNGIEPRGAAVRVGVAVLDNAIERIRSSDYRAEREAEERKRAAEQPRHFQAVRARRKR